MDNLITGNADNIAQLFPNPRFSFVPQDVTNYMYVKGPLDTILHFASPASPIDYLELPIQTLKVGSLGTHKALGLAKEKGAMVLFGDEASFAQWGSLSYTWSRKGQQPLVKTSGKRKAYKVMGLIDYFSGAFFYTTHTGRFNSATYEAFLEDVLAKTTQHLIIIQDGASYHTSKAMQAFFAKHTKRLTVYQLPRYSPEFNPIEFLWRNVKKQATHLRYVPEFEDLTKKVYQKLKYFANLPSSILGLMGRYCETLGEAVA